MPQTAASPVAAASSGPTAETVLEVRHWTDRLFSFRVTRPPALRFRSGEFVMIGLTVDGRPLMRAYSIASPSWDEALDFYSIKVPNGPLTSRLMTIQPGGTVLLGRKPTGTVVLDALLPGRRLYLLSTGTGIAPFVSIIRDPATYERYDEVILTHTCRQAAELAFGYDRVAATRADPLVGALTTGKLQYYTSLTQEAGPRVGRITTLIQSGQLFEDLKVPPFDAANDRAMICGSTPMIFDIKALLEKRGFVEGSVSAPGAFVIERAFVGQ